MSGQDGDVGLLRRTAEAMRGDPDGRWWPVADWLELVDGKHHHTRKQVVALAAATDGELEWLETAIPVGDGTYVADRSPWECCSHDPRGRAPWPCPEREAAETVAARWSPRPTH